MEVAAGLPNKKDIKKFEKFLEAAQIQTHLINEKISIRGYEIFLKYHQRGISIPDALIASTALFYKESLVTLNTKHFIAIKNLSLEKPY